MEYLPPLPPGPAGVPHPTADWPTGKLTPDYAQVVDSARVALFDASEDSACGTTSALLVVRHGRLVFGG